MQTIHILIKGKVQGVFFRASTKEAADSLGVQGWVKNTAADNVEAMATGNEKNIQQFINWCKQEPRKAIVTEVIVTQKEVLPFTDFSVIK
ncbi:MAG: acylphosphatase [Panacibacter sp.]